VEAINGTQWTVAGQTLTLDPQAAVDPNIAVGDTVKIQANVAADGSVVVKKVESSSKDDGVSVLADDSSSTPDPVATSSPDVSSTADPSSTQDPGNSQNEILGTIEAMTADTITINGVSYNLADFSEIKGNLVIGDQVKVHVIVNADGSFTIREIEHSTTPTVDDNSSNSNGTDDGPNHDLNDDNGGSGNGTDDGSNHDSNDDNGGGSGGDNSGPSGDSN
jgi:hypothetical protein